MFLIAADKKASEARSARLKALRIERDSSEAATIAAAPVLAKKPVAKRVHNTA